MRRAFRPRFDLEAVLGGRGGSGVCVRACIRCGGKRGRVSRQRHLRLSARWGGGRRGGGGSGMSVCEQTHPPRTHTPAHTHPPPPHRRITRAGRQLARQVTRHRRRVRLEFRYPSSEPLCKISFRRSRNRRACLCPLRPEQRHQCREQHQHRTGYSRHDRLPRTALAESLQAGSVDAVECRSGGGRGSQLVGRSRDPV